MSETASTAEHERPERRVRPRLRQMTSRRWTAVLLVWGAIVAAAGAVLLDAVAPDPWVIQGGRAGDLRGSLEVLNEGGPPLLKKDPSTAQAPPSSARYGPLGAGDDQGIYLYVPVLAHWLGVDDPLVMLKWLFIALFAATVLAYPLIFHRLFDSVPAGILAAPALLAATRMFAETGDLYWIQAWAVLALLPVVMLIARRWPRAGLAWLALIVLGASFASSIRSQAGLPVMIAAALVVLWQPRRWRWRGAGLVALVAAYLAVSGLGMTLAREYRDGRVDAQQLTVEGSTAHVFWHNLYIGLGFQPNDHAIKWSDTVAAEAALRERPDATYLSAEYEPTVRTLYFRILTDQPGFVIGGFAKKAMVTIDHLKVALAMLAILIPVMLLFGAQRQRMRRYLLLTVPALAIALLPPVLTIPAPSYASGWIATVRLLELLALGWLVSTVQREVIPWVRERRSASGIGRDVRNALGLRRRTHAVAAAAGACWLLIALSAELGPDAERDFCEWQVAPPNSLGSICPLWP